MGGINFEEDIRPLSEFRANTASLVKQVKTSGRPLILTQHGKSTVVLLDVSHYQSMVSRIELCPGGDACLSSTAFTRGREL
ncbi:MAG: type II toxin-antitoxin system Phd/YefM family antitoxin [Chlorobium sp.]|nr:MAG: type II toxin-antitoxin system Phd/YefM family antitoxin [Chlorobium sp.]